MSPRPRVPASRRRARRLLLAILVSVIVPTSGVLGAATPPSAAPTGPLPTLPDLPTDPADAAAVLVELVHGPDVALAVEATGELLRRAGIPLVTTAGAVVALPDHAVLADEPVYAPLVAQVAGAVRQGDFYAPDQLAELLAGLDVTNGPLPTATLLGGLGAWGKDPDALPESGASQAPRSGPWPASGSRSSTRRHRRRASTSTRCRSRWSWPTPGRMPICAWTPPLHGTPCSTGCSASVAPGPPTVRATTWPVPSRPTRTRSAGSSRARSRTERRTRSSTRGRTSSWTRRARRRSRPGARSTRRAPPWSAPCSC